MSQNNGNQICDGNKYEQELRQVNTIVLALKKQADSGKLPMLFVRQL